MYYRVSKISVELTKHLVTVGTLMKSVGTTDYQEKRNIEAVRKKNVL